MNDVFFYVAIIGYVLAAIFLIVAIVLFFKLRIPYVIKDLNGTIAQEEIKILRERAKTGKNERLKIYDPDIELSGKIAQSKKDVASVPVMSVDDSTSILQGRKAVYKNFVIVTDIVYIHTNDVI